MHFFKIGYLTVRLSYSRYHTFATPVCLTQMCFGPSALSLTTTYAIASLSFPPGTEMFHFPGFASLSGYRPCGLWVAPFGYPRFCGHLHLNVAFRSLSRPSSLTTTKASTVCPFYLNFCLYAMRKDFEVFKENFTVFFVSCFFIFVCLLCACCGRKIFRPYRFCCLTCCFIHRFCCLTCCLVFSLRKSP